MPFTVIWRAEAEPDRAWLHRRLRRRPASELWPACAEIEGDLRHNPQQSGVPLRGFRSIRTIASTLANRERLAVVYEVLPDDTQVLVHKVLLLPSVE
jgi:hypothetical protein